MRTFSRLVCQLATGTVQRQKSSLGARVIKRAGKWSQKRSCFMKNWKNRLAVQ